MEATVQLNARVQSRLGDAKTILKLEIRWKNHCQKLLFSPSSYQRYCSLSRGQDPDLEFCVCVHVHVCVHVYVCSGGQGAALGVILQVFHSLFLL